MLVDPLDPPPQRAQPFLPRNVVSEVARTVRLLAVVLKANFPLGPAKVDRGNHLTRFRANSYLTDRRRESPVIQPAEQPHLRGTAWLDSLKPRLEHRPKQRHPLATGLSLRSSGRTQDRGGLGKAATDHSVDEFRQLVTIDQRCAVDE